MYIQITTRCNMLCKHCCMSCTAEGEDMSLETFRKACDFSDMIALGGGEPTLHPLFWQMLGEVIASAEYVWMATNGSMTQIALALAKMAKKGLIGCDLSLDDYHDPIDPKVVEAFTEEEITARSNSYDARRIRDVSGKEVNGGRCDFGSDGCACNELFISPDGTVRVCGCDDAPVLGNINDGFEIPDWYERGECYKDQTIR